MAVEGVGLAASIAGLLSLGLQITGGIVTYLDAFKGREEELASLKQQNDALAAALSAIESSSSDLQYQRPEFTIAVKRNIQSCMKELNSAEELRVDLADRDKSTWTTRVENKKKKLTYAFHKSKIQQLVQRLQQASGVLQLTLTGLGLEFSKLNTNQLTVIESSANAQASELRLVRSEVAAVGTPIITIQDQLPSLQASINNTSQLVASNSNIITDRIEENSQAITHGIQLVHNSMELQYRQQQETLARIENLLSKCVEPQNEHSHPSAILAARVASKPAVLKELCDSMQTPKQISGQDFSLGHTPSYSENRRLSHVQDLRFSSVTGGICICPRPHRSTAKRGIQLGYISLSDEGHWPSCPLTKFTKKNRRALSVKYTGLARILKSVIDVTFAWNSGGGGFSISPSFTYNPIVDDRLDPAFWIIDLIGECFSDCNTGNRELFMAACLRKLIRLFTDKQAHPTAVNDRNESLMYRTALSFRYATSSTNRKPHEINLFLELVQILLSYGVAAFTYDTEGNSIGL